MPDPKFGRGIIVTGSDTDDRLEKGLAKYQDIIAQSSPTVIQHNKNVTWPSVDQRIMATRSSKVGRNETCPCGSGMKYKRCCGK